MYRLDRAARYEKDTPAHGMEVGILSRQCGKASYHVCVSNRYGLSSVKYGDYDGNQNLIAFCI